jgi:nucleoside-diphosphate-sugar epimerase
MSIFVIGGTGFIGRRLVRQLVARGESVTCMNTTSAPIAGVSVVRGDITQLDEVLACMAAAKPTRTVNLSYLHGSDNAPYLAMKRNLVGMANFFEAARLLGVRRVVYASSIAVNGAQKNYGDRPITEDDPCHGEGQYAAHKIFNEGQARDYADKYGMSITGIRPANVTGPDKFRGSVDHANCIALPARGRAVHLPHGGLMRLLIHVNDIADIFVRVLMADAPKFRIYNSGGTPISLRELAEMVRGFIPGATISFADENGGRNLSGGYLLDNSRLTGEFGVRFPPLEQRVQDVIAEARRAGA